MKKIILIISGILLAFICLETLLQTSSFCIMQFNKHKIYRKYINKLNTNTITILCIGESTTYKQWPVQLEQFLKENSSKQFNIINSALPSIGIEELVEQTIKQIALYKPNIVISMSGINNAVFANNKQVHKKYYLKSIELMHIIKKHIVQNICANDIKQSETYYLKLVDKYSTNNDTPIEFIKILEKQPRNVLALANLIFLYGQRLDVNNVKKYANIYFKRHPNEYDAKVLCILISSLIWDNDYRLLDNVILNLIKSQNIKNINEILKNSLVCNRIKLNELINIYEILTKNKVNSSILITIYEYLLKHNIKVKYPDYDITFSNKPNFNTETIKSAYINLAQILQKEQILYICMGYPTIPIDEFKNIFNTIKFKDEIIFVSNEKNFNDKLKLCNYQDIFIDKFAGTFGHCTTLGNTMIAENIGKVILDITGESK